MCVNPDALPYSSNKPETPGFQLELAREIAKGLGVTLNVEWILPRRRANVVNCDMLLDSVNNPGIHEGRLLLSRPYQTSGVALGLSRERCVLSTDYHELQRGQKVGVMINSVASVVLGKAGKTTSPYAFQADMVEDLEKGELYAIAVSSATMSYYIRQHPESGLKAGVCLRQRTGSALGSERRSAQVGSGLGRCGERRARQAHRRRYAYRDLPALRRRAPRARKVLKRHCRDPETLQRTPVGLSPTRRRLLDRRAADRSGERLPGLQRAGT